MYDNVSDTSVIAVAAMTVPATLTTVAMTRAAAAIAPVEVTEAEVV
jgi:hypothetical protein